MLGCYNLLALGSIIKFQGGAQGLDHAKVKHLIARDGHSREAPLALTHELMS